VFKTTGDPRASDALADSLLESFDLITSMPGLGKPRPEFGRELRSHLVGNYTVFYWPRLDHVEIARVLHQRSDLRRAFATQKRRKIKLTPDFEYAVWTRVDSGAYVSTEEVLGACVRALERVEAEDL
jgi:plasmid stabilization system protein ParE